jgi:two-component system sensor histidine kinase RegB
MWIAFGVAAVFIVYFVTRVRRSLAARETELVGTRMLASRSEKLGSLATLATGAAHELSTPLSTIAVVARELERDLERGVDASLAISDARLIRQEVERCREILVQMTADAGHMAGEGFAQTSLSGLLCAATSGLPDGERIEVKVEENAKQCSLYVPPHAVAQALRGVLKNAQQASPPDHEVVVHAAVHDTVCRIEVRDRGPGMEAHVLARAGEPFFSTREPGRGMGLGLFLTRVVLERLGGRVELESMPGRGTTAVLTLPLTEHARQHTP